MNGKFVNLTANYSILIEREVNGKIYCDLEKELLEYLKDLDIYDIESLEENITDYFNNEIPRILEDDTDENMLFYDEYGDGGYHVEVNNLDELVEHYSYLIKKYDYDIRYDL